MGFRYSLLLLSVDDYYYLIGFNSDFDGVIDDSLYSYHDLHFLRFLAEKVMVVNGDLDYDNGDWRRKKSWRGHLAYG